MKNSIKLGLAALALSVTLASCFGDDDKAKQPDSSSTTVKIDTAKTKIDSAGTDTTVKKSSVTTEKTEVKKN